MVAVFREPAPEAPVAADAIPVRLRRLGGSPRQVFALAIFASMVLAVFAAPDLPGWADRLGDAPFAEAAGDAARAWSRAIAKLGLDRPHNAIRDAVRGALDAQW